MKGTKESAYFVGVNRNKRAIALDIGKPDGKEILLKMLETADVLIENFRPGALEGWNLAPSDLVALNPKLIVLRISGYGQTGPYRDQPGFGVIGEAMGGMRYLAGDPSTPPSRVGLSIGDALAATFACLGAMIALNHRHQTGEGQVVDVSLLESMFGMMSPLASLYALTGELQPRMGAGLPYTVPRGTYQCSDGKWVGVSTSADSVAARVLGLLGLADDPRFTTFAQRMANRPALEAAMREWCSARTQAEVIAEFTAADAAIGPVLDMADIATDPHFAEREAIVDVGGTPMQNVIAKLSRTPGRLKWHGRGLDADGPEIREKGWNP